MFRHLANIYSVPDLRKKIFYTLMLIAVHRIGAHIPVPLVDPVVVKEKIGGMVSGGGVFGMIDMFSGGAFSQMTVFALGIMPYISASIILQLLMIVWPRLEKIAKEGEIGKKKINQYTRYGTVGLALAQSCGIGIWLAQGGMTLIPGHSALFVMLAALSITTGTCFIMWLGEKITEHGIGNGISIMITLGILARYPTSILRSLVRVKDGNMTMFFFICVLALFLLMTVIIVVFQTATRKIPIQHARRQVGRRMTQAQTQFLPLKINTAGVIPVIFSSAILQFFPLILTPFTGGQASTGFLGWLGNLFNMQSTVNPYDLMKIDESFLEQAFIFDALKSINMYVIIYIVLTAFFCYFYTAITFNPIDLAENLKKSGAFVPGRRPGKATSDYIEFVMVRITFVGAFYLCAVSVLPMVMVISYGMDYSLMDFVGGTGLIIVVSVLLDTLKQVESQLMVRHYEGFRIRRRGA
ncbi:preprotein translocase subunit SecY [Candidatus Sumerlaeota bacterium]|nr:preprotein translocase subunit SecY [Candidatus Sumerlaeota bacterium]